MCETVIASKMHSQAKSRRTFCQRAPLSLNAGAVQFAFWLCLKGHATSANRVDRFSLNTTSLRNSGGVKSRSWDSKHRASNTESPFGPQTSSRSNLLTALYQTFFFPIVNAFWTEAFVFKIYLNSGSWFMGTPIPQINSLMTEIGKHQFPTK